MAELSRMNNVVNLTPAKADTQTSSASEPTQTPTGMPSPGGLPPHSEGAQPWWQQWVNQLVDIFSGVLFW